MGSSTRARQLGTIRLVANFHHSFDIPVAHEPCIPPQTPMANAVTRRLVTRMEELAEDIHKAAAHYNGDPILLRLQLMQEELSELGRAMVDRDLVESLDALLDMRYVADGTVLTLGMANIFDDAFEEVQRSNMSKLVDGVPIKNEAGRVVKPPTWSSPVLEPFLKRGE